MGPSPRLLRRRVSTAGATFTRADSRCARAAPVALAALVALAAPAAAPAFELSGHAGAEVRAFANAPQHPRQRRHAVSLVLTPELYRAWDDGEHSIVVTPFLRVDSADPARTRFDLREALYRYARGDWELRLGVGRVFWGVAESRHLVDVINQTDLVEDLDGEDRLGQPMASAAWTGDIGTVEAFVLTGFRERTFPGPRGRLRTEPAVDTGRTRYESAAGRGHVDLALRWSRTLGDVDLGVSHFHGTGRDPRLVAGRDAAGRVVLAPHYDQVDQTSIDLQAATGAWLWKLEALRRSGSGRRATHVAWVGGFEYTVAGVAGTRADLGVLAEHLFDGRGSGAPQPFENDLFLGLRLSLNDAAGSRVLAGVIHDLDGQGDLWSVEASRRLGDRWRVELEARAWTGIAATDVQRPLARDDHVTLRLLRYF